jgi:aspartate kinase
VIAFEEAAEMATFGAKVLHPATLLPAVRSDIPVFVGSSKDPKAGGTLVCKKTENPPLFRALALRRRQTLVTLHSLNMLHSRGFLAEVFGILARHNISVDLITTSEVSIALTLDTTGSINWRYLLTQSLLIELSELCRVKWKRTWRWLPSSATSCPAPAAWAKRCSAYSTRSTSA